MGHQARMGGQLSEDGEEDDLGGEQQTEGREEAPPAREGRHPDGQEQARLVGGRRASAPWASPGAASSAQRMRGQGGDRPRGAEHRAS